MGMAMINLVRATVRAYLFVRFKRLVAIAYGNIFQYINYKETEFCTQLE